MLLIQPTKKLADELKVKIVKEEMPANDPLFSWHANIFIYKRRKYVLVMNDKSRYNFILGNYVKKDFMAFEERVKRGIKENLLADQFDEFTVQKYMKQCKAVHYAPTSNRSIISQINEMIIYTKLSWEQSELSTDEIDLYEQNRDNNRFVMLTLPEVYSVEAMKRVVKEKWDI